MEQIIVKQMLTIERLHRKFIRDHGDKVEIWLPIGGYENYSVSTFGRVMNKRGKVLKGNVNSQGYLTVALCINGKPPKTYSIHRIVAVAFIANPAEKPSVDHIDTCRTNNYISNLRWATHSENRMNASKHSDSTSGITGVSWHKQHKKWYARITIDGITKHLGLFNTKEAAKEARIKAVNRLFKGYANSSQKR